MEIDQPMRSAAFLSSFTTEFGGWREDGTLDTDGLRYKVYALGQELGTPVWVAEVVKPELKENNPLERVDVLWEEIRRADIFLCILGGKRRGSNEHGTIVRMARNATAISFFESELVLAALLRKRIEVFVAKDFDPGPRLSGLLEMLRFALPKQQWRENLEDDEILGTIENLLAPTSLRFPPISAIRSVGGRLLSRMHSARALRGGRPLGQREVFFLDGVFESNKAKPNMDVIQEALALAEGETKMGAKLLRTWIALRELMATPPEQGCSQESLSLWIQALGKWASSGAWFGLHGHNFVGQLAALYSVRKARGILLHAGGKPPELLEHPGGLASALYSTAKLMPSRNERKAVFQEGLFHVHEAITERGITANLLQLRGSFHLKLWDISRAVSDFEGALTLRHVEKAGPSQLGESTSELGFARLFQGRVFKGLELLEEGATLMALEKEDRPGFYRRGLEKLAWALRLNGRFIRAQEVQAEADNLAKSRDLTPR